MPTSKDVTEEPRKAGSPAQFEIPRILPPTEPFRGIEPFRFCDQIIFSERRDQAARLLKIVFIYRGTLLAGGSGVGKSSLVNAGFLPGILQEGFLPERVRVRPEQGAEFQAERIPLGDADQPPYLPSRFISPSLIESSVAVSVERFTGILSAPHSAGAPLLVFDQFEELITLFDETPDSPEKYKAAQIAQTSIIRTLARLLQDPAFPVKCLFVFREDYYLKLGKFFDRVPGLREQGMYLEPLPTARLKQVIRDPFVLAANAGHAFERPIEDSLADEIAKAIAAYRDSPYVNLTEVQIICQTLWRDPDGTANFIAAANKVQEIQTLLERYIDGRLAGLSKQLREPTNAILIRLITTSNTRNIVAEPDLIERLKEEDDVPPAITTKALNELVTKSRLVNKQKRGDTAFYDIVSEFLIPWIRAERLRVEQVAQRRKQRRTAALAGALAIALLATLCGGFYAFKEHPEYYREFDKQNGFPVGIMQISESTARRLPVSFRLTRKGITWNPITWKGITWGWLPHLQRALRVEAVNSLLEPTTNHTVFPYLWKGENESAGPQDTNPGEKGEKLGLKTVCKWEFASTKEGEIIYERALDRASHMVYALIYSPSGSVLPSASRPGWGLSSPSPRPSGSASPSPLRSSSPSTRFARFVGPNGLPQRQRQSAAEIVEIHYDNVGWEDRVMYFDGNSQPATGPDGAFGQEMKHNQVGQLTSFFSLNSLGRRMIDNAGNSGMLQKYNEKGYEIEDTSVGTGLERRSLKDGYAIAKYQYDADGRMILLTFHGVNDEPVLSKKNGYHGWKAQYDEHGNQSVFTYLGLDEKPTLIADGYATLKVTYDARSNVIRLTFHGVNDEAILSKKNGCHGWKAEYDKQDHQTVITYLGLDEKPTLIADGYATLKSTYDARGNQTGENYYGAKGEPVLSKENGYHGWKAEYDKQDHQTVITYLGLDEKPTLIADGYATLKSTYDARGNETGENYYGAKGEPVLSKENGYHGWKAEYDEQDHQTAITYIGLDGKPILIADGYATFRSTYDTDGSLIKQNYYGINGEPALSNENGYHGWKGDRTVLTYLGLDGKPMLIGDNYATMKSTYDAHGNVLRQTFHGVNGEPIQFTDGYYGREAEYDQDGNRTLVTYLGLDGKPMLIADGYATFKSTYDTHRNVLRQTFYGANDEPVLSKEGGYHGWKAHYEDGNETSRTYLGLDGKPTLIADGYATLKSTYDSTGNQIGENYYGVNDEPVLSKKNGYHGWKAPHEDGNETSRTYLGLDGKPVALPAR